ncbi:MAG: P-type ATPase, partial [Promethearchaeota archaeon]
LKKMAPHSAKVKRDGIIKEIYVKDVVPGDIIKLEEGDKIPADARLIVGYSLSVDESILTGESKPVHKTPDIVEKEKILADRKNIVYSNTIITRGNGDAIVISTGMNTEIGKIAEKIQKEDEPSPFQQDIDRFGKKLGIVIVIICLILFISEIAILERK